MLIALWETHVHYSGSAPSCENWRLTSRRPGARWARKLEHDGEVCRWFDGGAAKAGAVAMLSVNRFRRLEAALRRRSYGPTIEWSENIQPPINADDFAERTIYVILNSGFRNSVAEPIYRRCIAALRIGLSATTVFGHPGKAPAIDTIWQAREVLFEEYGQAADPVAFLEEIRWIGPVTALHLGKNLGFQYAKPDIHMERLARRDKTTTARLCARLARATGYRVATIDTVLWKACESGLLNSAVYERDGWTAAISAEVLKEAWQPIVIDKE